MTSAPSGAFECADGLLNLAANKDEQWVLLANHLGRADLLDRPEYATREDRKANRYALKADLETTLKARPARDWATELNRIGVPAGAVLTVPEVLEMPQIADRGMLATYPDAPGVGRDITVVRTGVKIDGEAPRVDAPPPMLGADNDEIWGALGFSSDEIGRLREEGVI